MTITTKTSQNTESTHMKKPQLRNGKIKDEIPYLSNPLYQAQLWLGRLTS
jgi:hypothetical protein